MMLHRRHLILSIFTLGMAGIAGVAYAQAGVAAGPYYATPAWDQTLTCSAQSCPRFIVLSNMNHKAVMDRETGLVWLREAVDTSGGTQAGTWSLALSNCENAHWGTGRKGWRLPAVEELTSLLTVGPPHTFTTGLPAGHPFAIFNDPGSATYWTSTTSPVPADGSRAKIVVMTNGEVATAAKDSSHGIWCVRGGK